MKCCSTKFYMVNEVEQEEHRMPDLSDWASSVTSAADIQVMMKQYFMLVVFLAVIYE